MTWASQITRVGSLLFVLPLVLRKFSDAEVAAWYLFMGMITLSALADFGFRGTFIRLFAFGAGGATDIEVLSGNVRAEKSDPNWDLIERLASTMRRIYAVTSVTILVVLATVGTAAMWRPLDAVPDRRAAWIAWGLICVTATAEFQGRVYKNFLDGLNHVAMARRVETLTKLGAILTSFAVMLLAPTLLNLVIANRAWAFLNVFRDRFLARRVNDARFASFRALPFERAFFSKVWRPAWRSGVAGLLSTGLANVTGVVYAQFAGTSALAAYLFAVKLISEIRNLTYAPLYSKLPLLGRLRAQGDVVELVRVSRRGINTSYAVFLLGVLVVGFGAEWGLHLIESRTTFVPTPLWWLLAIGYFGNRVGAMHMQLYQTTNDVVAHIWDSAAGVVLALIMITLVGSIGVYAFPIAIIAAYLALHAPVSLVYSYRASNLGPREFVMAFVAPPLVVLATLAALLVTSL